MKWGQLKSNEVKWVQLRSNEVNWGQVRSNEVNKGKINKNGKIDKIYFVCRFSIAILKADKKI